MKIEKHTIVKEVGNLYYSFISPVYKHEGNFNFNKQGYCYDDIVFIEPLKIEWKYSEVSILDEAVKIKKIDVEYDFGMPQEFLIEQRLIENPDFWKYRHITLDSPIIDIVKQFVETELIFALRRNNCELNAIQWALKGWLQSRVEFPWNNN